MSRVARAVLLPPFRLLQLIFRWWGFEVRRVSISGIRDAHLYRPFFEPWTSTEWSDKLRSRDPRSLVPPGKKYVLYTQAKQAMLDADGAVAECGVYRGGTAILLAELAEREERVVYLFDTFGGMPETDPEKDVHRKGDFADTSLAGVKTYLAKFNNIVFQEGAIPGTFAGLEHLRFSFVHIDVDIFQAHEDALSFFYPRMSAGGVLLFDDYGAPTCPGARMAVDQFFCDKPEVLFVLPSGQCLARKAVNVTHADAT